VCAFELGGEFIQGSDFGEDVLVESVELPIQVFPAETGAEVACHHPVRVQHGHYLEDEIGTQLGADWIVAGQEAEQSLDDEGGVRFSGVDAAGYQDYLLLLGLLAVGRVGVFFLRSIGDGQQGHIEPS
jgi:hypothetical protein